MTLNNVMCGRGLSNCNFQGAGKVNVVGGARVGEWVGGGGGEREREVALCDELDGVWQPI